MFLPLPGGEALALETCAGARAASSIRRWCARFLGAREEILAPARARRAAGGAARRRAGARTAPSTICARWRRCWPTSPISSRRSRSVIRGGSRRWRAMRRRRWGCPRPRSRRSSWRAGCTISAASASRTRSGTSRARSTPASGRRSRPPAVHRAGARAGRAVRARRPAGRRRSRAHGRRAATARRRARRAPRASWPRPTSSRRCPSRARTARAHRPSAPPPSPSRRRPRGRLDRAAVNAVLEAAGQTRVRAAPPRGLTERELEVLRLLARGQVDKEIAARARHLAPHGPPPQPEHLRASSRCRRAARPRCSRSRTGCYSEAGAESCARPIARRIASTFPA